MKTLDPTTFGSNPADIYLSLLLNQKEDGYLNKKIGRFMSCFNHTIENLSFTDKKVAKNIYLLLRKEYFHKVESEFLVEQVYKDLIKNHITTRLRILLNSLK